MENKPPVLGAAEPAGAAGVCSEPNKFPDAGAAFEAAD